MEQVGVDLFIIFLAGEEYESSFQMSSTKTHIVDLIASFRRCLVASLLKQLEAGLRQREGVVRLLLPGKESPLLEKGKSASKAVPTCPSSSPAPSLRENRVGRLLEWTSEMASSRAQNRSGLLVRGTVKPSSISDAFPRSSLFGTGFENVE
ncbi:hypothetical protein PIB30_099563 [Stylosanthes scabra]|uniref:Uncharacterized protein n=1 Tax=Stylosanthes scabra TaxID=79078 RepID=A0ABU6SZN7_9FABA|nr:hypothetical protein [Stylosanthes scabra]